MTTPRLLVRSSAFAASLSSAVVVPSEKPVDFVIVEDQRRATAESSSEVMGNGWDRLAQRLHFAAEEFAGEAPQHLQRHDLTLNECQSLWNMVEALLTQSDCLLVCLEGDSADEATVASVEALQDVLEGTRQTIAGRLVRFGGHR